SMAALALVRLARLTGNRDLSHRARRVLEAYALPMKRSPAAFPTMLLAAHLLLTEPAAAPAGLPDPVQLRLAAPSTPVFPGREATPSASPSTTRRAATRPAWCQRRRRSASPSGSSPPRPDRAAAGKAQRPPELLSGKRRGTNAGPGSALLIDRPAAARLSGV